MSGRRSKKNQKLGSSRRGARGLRVPEEKDNDECDNGQNEIHTTTDPNDNQSNGTALQAQSHQTDHQTSALDCSPHAGAQIHKDSDMEAELPERKQKIGSTRKRTDGFTNVRKFEIHDEMGTTEEYGEEQVTQTNTSVVKEEHISFAEDEQRNLHEHSTSLNVSSDLSQQFGGELAVPQNIMDTVSQSKEHNSIDHQEITSDSQNAESNMSNDAAMRQSAYSSDQEIQQVSTSGHKRKMGSTRKPLAGNRGKNLEGQEPLRNTPGEIWEAEVKSSSEPEFNMLEEMMQTWDDVKRNDSPTNTSSHTESEKAEELNVSSETETNIRSVAYSVFDPTQQLFEKNHKTPLLNKHRMEHKEESLHIQAIEDFTEQGFENQLEVQNGKTMISVDKEHSANETDLSDSSLYANYNLPNLLPVISLDSLLPEDCKPSCDVMTEIAVCSQFKINNEDSAVSFPEAEDVAESREIYVEKDTDDVSETLITCDVAVTEIVMDVKDFTEHCVDLQTLENESVDSKTEYETDKFEMIDQDDVKDYHNMTQIFINAKDKEEGESFIQCMSEENAEVEVLLKAKCPAFDRETETGDKYKVMEDFEESQHEMSSSLVVISDVTEHLANIQDNDIKSDLQTEKISSDNNLEAFNVSVNAKNISGVTDSGLVLQDTVTESSLEFDTISDFTEINIISQDFQEEDLNQIVHKEKISISVEKDAGPVKVLDSALMTSSSEKSKAESICKTTESQNLTKSHVEFQENAIDVENVPVEGDTKPHLEIQTAIEMFDSTIVKGGIKENVCEVDVFMKHVELVGDTVTEDRNMTIETDFLQNNMSTDTNQETSENVERASTVIDSGLVMQDAVPESFPESNAVSEKAEINIIPDDSQGKDSHPKLSPLVHNRKMGSTRRPLRGNKEKEQDFKKIEVDAEKEDTKSHPEIQDHNNVVDHMMQRMMDVKHTEEEETSETVKMAQQEHPSENKECHTEITVEQEQKCSSDISQIKDAPPLVESVDMETEREVGEENRDGETKNITVNDEDTKSEEIFSLEDINSEVTVTSLTRQELFIQTTDEEVYDIIQKGKDTYEAREEETFLSANTEHTAVNRRNEIEDAQSDSQSDLQTINPIQNRVLTEEENDKSSDMNLEQTELQQTEHAENVSAVTDSGVSIEDVVTVDSEESHTVHENISEISEDSQKEEMQSKLNPLFHKRKMGSTRRPLRGNTGPRKYKEFHDDSDTFNIETLINEEKDHEREIRIEKDADSGKVLDSEESTAESICDITASQNLIKSHAEFQENAGDVDNVKVDGDTKPHLEIQTEIEMFDSTIVERGKVENVFEADVLMKQVEFVGDTVTVDSNMTTETDFLQNNTSTDTKQETLKASETAERASTVIDSGLLLQDAVPESFPESNAVSEKAEINIIPDDSQGEDSHPKLCPLVHKRKMGSTRRPLRGNKEKEQDFKKMEEKTDKEDIESDPKIQDQNNVVDHMVQRMMDVKHTEEEETSETVKMAQQELCEHPSENKECHTEITVEQEQKCSSDISQTKDAPPLVESVDMETEREVGEENRDGETKNITVNDEDTKSEEIFSLEDINSEVTVTSLTHQELFIQTTDEEVYDIIQKGKDTYEASEEETFLSANTEHTAVNRRNEIEDAQSDSQSDLQTINPIQNRVLTEEENDKSSDMNLEQTEHAENVSAVTDSGVSFEDVVTVDSEESHTVHENISEISEDSQKEEMQSKLNPLFHKRKMGSTRRTLRGNTGQRKHKVFYDDSDTFNIETLINEEKDDEREIHIEKDADSGEMLDSEESTAESICDITASQNLIKSHAEFQENAGDVEKVPVEGNTKTHLEIQTEIEMFDSTIVAEGIKEKVCEVDVLMKQVEFVGDTVTVDSKMTTETDFFQNNTTINTNQEMLKASKSFDSVCSVADSVIESFPESNTIYEKNKISIIPEDSQREDLHPKLSPVVHKRKMGSTRRPLRGNKEKEQDLKEKKEDTEPHSEVQDQNNVVDQNIKIEKVMAVGHNEEEENSRTCEHPSENKKCHREITLEQEQRSSPNIFQTQTEPSQHDADQNLPVVLESTSEFKDKPLVLSDDMFMEESQVTESSEPVLMVDSPQTESEEIYSASSRSLPKRKMGSTRKTLRGRKMENKRDFGEEKEGEMDEETTDLKETFTLEEAISLTTTETQVHQTPLRLDLNIEAHDIQDTGNKPDKHTENPEQAKIFVNEQNDPISYTNQGPSEYSDNVTVSSLVTISAEFHKEEIQSKLNPVAQRRKMGSTRKTLRGNNGQRRREIESKNMDGDSESELKSDENTQFKEPTSFERVVQPETIPKIFFKPEDEVKKVINSQSNEVPLEAYTITDLESKMLVCAPDPKVGEKNYLECSEPSGSSESEKSDKSRRSLEVESDTFQIGDNQLQLTVSDQSHQVLSEKHPQTETVTVRKKMSSTRKNFRGKRGESDGNLEQTDDSLLNEIEKELNKSSQSSQNVDYQVMINEPNSGNLSVETSHLNTPENSKPEHKSNKDNFTSPQVTKSQRSESPSELSSPGRRRKMGSTRKNPRHQVKREDDNDEMGEKYKQGPRVSKKDLETAEESKECDITNKEYLDIPIALTSSCELEENAASVMPESTSPSTKRKFGSRRTNMSRSGLVISEGGNEIEKGEHTPDSSEVHQHSDDIMVHDSCLSLRTENQPIIQPISEYGNMEIRSKEHVPCAPTKPTDTAAGLVSLDQIIKAGQHDRSPGKTQAADLKNISDMEAIQFNVVMVGNSCVGKTSFIRRFHAGQFSLDYCSTIGVDTCVHNVVLDDKVVKLHIWDTAGQERFHSITTQVFHRADSLLIMYEITSSKSFISVRDWISQVQEKARDDVIILLLGNKSDCAEREVQVQEGEALAREYNISFMECSAATGQNVSECIKSLAELLVQQKNQKMEKYTVLKREQPQKKSGCC